MPHLTQTLLATLAAAASLAAAQTPTTTQLYLVGVDIASPFEASVVAVSGPTTTFAVHCAPGTESSNCGISDARVTVAPDAYDIRDSEGSTQYAQHCSVSAGVPTGCTGAGDGDPGNPVPVKIVAGADKLGPTPAPSSSPSGAPASSTGSGTSSSGMASTSARSSSSSTGAASTPSAMAGGAARAGVAVGALVGVAGAVVAAL